jgi:hypothetical protein
VVAALVPITAIEALFLRPRLAISYGEAFAGTSVANVVSTIVGIPVAWFILVVPELLFESRIYRLADRIHEFSSPLSITFQMLTTFPWLDPDETRLYWTVPVASALLLIPSYFASIWLERPICRHVDSSIVRRAVTEANQLSYAALFVVACGWLGYSILTHK